MFSKYKRGQVNDFAALLVVPFALGIIFLIVSLVFEDVNDGWQASNLDNRSKEIMNDNESKYVNIVDNGFIIIFVGLIIAGVVGLFILDTHPILFTMVALAFLVFFVVAAMMGNSFSDITETGAINAKLQDFTFLPLIMENLLGTLIIVGGIFALAFFAKLRLG